MRQLTRSEVGPWTIVVAIAIFMLVCAVPAHCQSTNVSATVLDQAGTVWANGTWKLDIIPANGGSNIFWNGSPLPATQWHYSGTLNSSGVLPTTSIPATNFITPTGATYTATVCPNATSACTVITRLAITGASASLSAAITAASPAPRVLPVPVPRAYNDAEISITPSQTGYFYQNVTTNQPRYWGQDQVWHNFIVGVSSLTTSNFTPLFNTSLGADPANPALTFTAQTAAANKVYANCTGSTANPNFCSLTPAMIPALPYLPASTTLFYQSVHNPPGTTLPSEGILTFDPRFTCTNNAGISTECDLTTGIVTPGTYAFPASVAVDTYGRVISITAGSAPPPTGSASLTPNGWEITPLGHIHEWGLAGDAGGGTITVTFPLPFPHAVFSVVAVDFFLASSRDVSVLNFTTTTFDVHNNGPSNGEYWQADGW
jgi:hypothetical protein